MQRGDWNREYAEQDEPGAVRPDELLVREVDGLEPGHALDLGCGTGANAIWLAERGWRVTGVDWADAAIIIARASARAKGVDVAFVVADITEWSPPSQLDLVASTFALPRAGDQRDQALAKAVAAVAPGGTLLV